MIDRYAERFMRLSIAADRARTASLLVGLGGVLEMERALDGERAEDEAQTAGRLYGQYREACDEIERTEEKLAWHLRERARMEAA